MTSNERLPLDQRLNLNKFYVDKETHIKVDQQHCKICQTKVCLTTCPAEVYTLMNNEIVFNYEKCLECGTCSIACRVGGKGGIDWKLPRGGFGIHYRYG